jgi:hypothetical protein
MSFKAGSFVDTAALESCFVATKASPGLRAKDAPTNMAWRAQPTTPFTPHPLGPPSLSPDASHEVTAARGVRDRCVSPSSMHIDFDIFSCYALRRLMRCKQADAPE